MQLSNWFACVVGVAAAVSLSGVTRAQDHCNDILKQGIFNTVQIRNESKLVEDFESYIHTSDLERINKGLAAGIDLSVPLKGLPVPVKVGAAYSQLTQTDLQKLRTQWEGKHISREELHSRFDRIASDPVVLAWRECMKNKALSKGVALSTAEIDADHFKLTVSYSSVTDAPLKVDSWLVFGAELLDGETQPAELKRNTTKDVSYKRTRKDVPVAITLHTANEDFSCIVPPPPAPPAQPVRVIAQLRNVNLLKAKYPGQNFGHVTVKLKFVVETDGQTPQDVTHAWALTGGADLEAVHDLNFNPALTVTTGRHIKITVYMEDCPGHPTGGGVASTVIVDAPIEELDLGQWTDTDEGKFSLVDPGAGNFQLHSQLVYRVVKK